MVEARGRYFTRHPLSGVKRASAEVFFASATAQPLLSLPSECARQLHEFATQLEAQVRDALQLEFEVTDGTVRLLGLGPVERSPQAAVKIAVSLVQEGVLSREEALLRVRPEDLDRLLLPTFEPAEVRQATRQGRLLATGVGMGPGATAGAVAREVSQAWRLLHDRQPVILVCDELTYRERDLLPLLSGLVVRQGRASARLAAEQHEIPGVLVEDELGTHDALSLDAHTGEVFQGRLTLVPGTLSADAATLLAWADEVSHLKVRANVDSASEATLALGLGAQGVGLFRIETLLQQPHRLAAYQAALKAVFQAPGGLPGTGDGLASGLEDDLVELFRAASAPSRPPFALRLMDAPLASTLRHWRDNTELPPDYFEGKWETWLHELNPLQGMRCGRVSLKFPALLQLQVTAILRAWERAGACLRLQIMLPGLCDPQELRILRELIPAGGPEVGSMLELPRACLRAGDLEADFLSFGTGDLTETTCGISRYDAPLSFLPDFLEQGVFARDPFQVIDEEGVGALMDLAVQAARARRTLEIGTCGRQASHRDSVAFCHRLGLDYVSVTPGHVPAVRLAAAQAALKHKKAGPGAGSCGCC